ncbi:hypothetical protein IAT38_002678 [Cryptococcus sp. DSM 104549]
MSSISPTVQSNLSSGAPWGPREIAEIRRQLRVPDSDDEEEPDSPAKSDSDEPLTMSASLERPVSFTDGGLGTGLTPESMELLAQQIEKETATKDAIRSVLRVDSGLGSTSVDGHLLAALATEAITPIDNDAPQLPSSNLGTEGGFELASHRYRNATTRRDRTWADSRIKAHREAAQSKGDTALVDSVNSFYGMIETAPSVQEKVISNWATGITDPWGQPSTGFKELDAFQRKQFTRFQQIMNMPQGEFKNQSMQGWKDSFSEHWTLKPL